MKKLLILSTAALLFLTGCGGTLSKQDAKKELEAFVRDIRPTDNTYAKSKNLAYLDDAQELPDIEKTYPKTVEGQGNIDVEILTSPEKAGSANDGLFNEYAETFNANHYTIDGKTVSVSIRSVPSGTASDYIATRTYNADAYSPSNTEWGALTIAKGGRLELIAEKTAGNTGGLLVKGDLYDTLNKDGKVDIKDVISQVENGKTLGYTNPYSSSTGLSLLTQLLYEFDSANPISENAKKKLAVFHKNIPTTFVTAQQLRDAAKHASMDMLSVSYQTYKNTPELQDYKYLPMGIRHDNPIYANAKLSAEKKEVLRKFVAFMQEEQNRQKAKDFGFDALGDYTFNAPPTDGNMLLSMQKLWKDNKSAGKKQYTVFVIDRSGSMQGAPMNKLKESMLNAIKYLPETTDAGLVSYASDVTINVPLTKMDTDGKQLLAGNIESIQPQGGTATYNALFIAAKMLTDIKEKDPNALVSIMLLSDGEQNEGYGFDKAKRIVKALQIPINTVDYNADLGQLKEISSINEAASLNADNDNIVYQLKQLFAASY